MKRLQILGTGCAACERLAELTVQAAEELGIAYEIEKIGEIEHILEFDVPGTPALVVDGEVRTAGRVPALGEIKAMLQ